MLSAQGLANFPANKAKITIDINGAPHPAITLRGEERVSNGFEFVLTIFVDKFTSLNSYIGATTRLEFFGQDGIARTIIGVVTKINELGWKDDQTLRVELVFESNLSRLRHQKDTRIVLGHTVPDLIRETCERNGLIKDQLHFDLSRPYPVKPYTLQANETDWDFISRLAANSGIYFYSIVKDDQEVIVFADHNAHCPYIAREVLHFIETSGANNEIAGNSLVGIHHLAATARKVIPQSRIHDFNEETPSTQLLASTALESIAATKATPQPGETLFGLGSRTLDESDGQSKRITEFAGAYAFDLNSKGNVVDMAAGHICSVEATHFDAQYNGDYFITHVIHESSQFAGQGENDPDIAYRAAASCIKRETPFRTATIRHPELPMTLTARIESDGPYAKLDEQGKYNVRALFDLSDTQHTQATIPLRRLSPYGGPPNQSNVGMHTPLHDGDEVLISCLNGDPDRPMIVGTVPNPERMSPVTSNNPSVNRLRTMSDNELTFDDTKEKEAITLRTYEGYNILHLDHAAVGHKIRLATEHGAMVTFAKKTIHRESGDSMTERVGNDRLVKVKNMSRTETQNSEIHHQANTDHKHTAYKNFRTESGQNTELQTGRHMIMDVADHTKITIKGSGGLFATVQSNDVFIQSANKIDVKGQGGGDITFEQSGGGFKVSSGGVVSFYGKKVFFGGSGGVSLNGKVNYSVPGPSIPGAVGIKAPIPFAGIEPLIDDQAPKIIHLSWSQKRAAIGQAVELRYTVVNVKPGNTATIDIYEVDSDGSKDKIDTQTQTIDDGHGHYSLTWQRKAEDADNDIKGDLTKEESASLFYIFEIKTSDAESNESPQLELADTLFWKPIISTLHNYAKHLALDKFIEFMQVIFHHDEKEIPLSAYKALYDDLWNVPFSLIPRAYVIGKSHIKGRKNGYGSYNDKYNFALIARELVSEAKTDSKQAALLYAVMLEEFGHHIDYLLRNKYSSVSGDAKWDEGAMFALSIIDVDFGLINLTNFAKHVSVDPVTYQETTSSWINIRQQHFNSQRIMSEKRGYIVAENGEVLQLNLFDSALGQIDRASEISGGCGEDHYTIEKYALTRAGIADDKDIKRIYFGNWLRDMSQFMNDKAIGIFTSIDLTPAEAKDFITTVFDISATRQFRDKANYALDVIDNKNALLVVDTYRVTQKRLGEYVPAEHIDNVKDPKQLQGWPIDNGTLEKTFIKKSRTYIAKKLTEAAKKGRTDDGMRAFGEALHVLEDFYAHSNYVELKSLSLDYGSTKLNNLVQSKVRSHTAKHNNTDYPLVTGTFGNLDITATISAKITKLIPTDKHSLYSERSFANQIIIAYWQRKGGIWKNAAYVYDAILTGGEALEKAIKVFGNDFVEWVKKKLELTAKFIKKALFSSLKEYVLKEIKLYLINWLTELGKKHLIPEPTTDAELKEVEKLWKDIDKLSNIIRSVVNNKDKKELLIELQSSTYPELSPSTSSNNYVDAADQLFKLIKLFQDLTMDIKSTDPTHTQLAKDYCKHYLHDLAITLAKVAVEDVAKQMKLCWDQGYNQQNVQTLVIKANQYLVHPNFEKFTHLDTTIKSWWKKNGKSVNPNSNKHHFH